MILESPPDEPHESQGELVPGPPEVEDSPPNIFLLAVLFEAGLGFLALITGWIVGYWPMTYYALTPKAAGVGALATLPLLLGLLLIEHAAWGPLVRLRRDMHVMVLPLFRGLRAWQLAAISLAAGFGEELMFRGLIQGGLMAALERGFGFYVAAAVALIAASVLFGLMHPISKTYAVLCVLVGLYLGAAWMLTGNLLVPMVTHALYDFLALSYLLGKAARMRRSGPEQ